jgi:hypothetical protein
MKKGGKVNLKAYNRDFRAAVTLKDRMRCWWE